MPTFSRSEKTPKKPRWIGGLPIWRPSKQSGICGSRTGVHQSGLEIGFPALTTRKSFSFVRFRRRQPKNQSDFSVSDVGNEKIKVTSPLSELDFGKTNVTSSLSTLETEKSE